MKDLLKGRPTMTSVAYRQATGGAGAAAAVRNRTPVLLADQFRCRMEDLAEFRGTSLLGPAGYFRFGPDVICHGQCTPGIVSPTVRDARYDASSDIRLEDSTVELPFDPAQVVDGLRFERYLGEAGNGSHSLPTNAIVRRLYYGLRPALPVAVRKRLQGLYFRWRTQSPFPAWPVDSTADRVREQLLVLSMKARGIKKIPFIWFWPNGAPSCTIVTHDVETGRGLSLSPKLMGLEDSFGIKSSFQVVPEGRYPLSDGILGEMRNRGFEVNIHDLNHDGRLFFEWEEFAARAQRINAYAKQLGAAGFRSAVMYRNLDWLDALEVSYDMSVPNVAHLDPQKGGCCTVFPFFNRAIVELPTTMTQDYSLFHVLNDLSIELWKQQISMIREKSGLISFIVHPDYLNTKRTWDVYVDLLEYLCDLRSQGKTWIALPNKVAEWWRQRSQMNLVQTGDSWRIEGEGWERACVAFAEVDGDSLRYIVNPGGNLSGGSNSTSELTL